MIRKIIVIDEEKCNGCGLCARACHEGAIDIVNGKARLAREHFCDGLGDCLPACPMGAITFEQREAPAYDEAAVLAAKKPAAPVCPGTRMAAPAPGASLRNWPVQIKLAGYAAPCFQDADLLIAADCTAFACPQFHEKYLAARTVLIGCPKLDGVNYAEKLTAIFLHNDIRSILVTRMQVPCCGGLPFAVQQAVAASGKDIPVKVVILSPDGSEVDG